MGDEAVTGRTDLLIQNKVRFLNFLERRLGSREDAEDLLQTAYLKALSAAETLRDEEKIVPWFYQLLAHETETTAVIDDEELFREVCRCVKGVSEALKDEYREILLRVELRDEPLKRAASELGITPNNASVRLHRARRVLREALQATCGVCTEHGCLDCSCRKGAHGPPFPE